MMKTNTSPTVKKGDKVMVTTRWGAKVIGTLERQVGYIVLKNVTYISKQVRRCHGVVNNHKIKYDRWVMKRQGIVKIEPYR